MNSETVDSITGWEQVPFDGGYAGLHALADSGFSGAVSHEDAWAFMLNGRLIGIVDGSLATFETGGGTAYTAPDPALALLYTMQAQGGEKQAEYYTNNTSISEANTTLSSGDFTGYIELSDNVLSGDYYVVFYGGKSMSVAFIGNSRRLLTDEEAFERADDEVGIYQIYASDIDVIEIPETEAGSTAGMAVHPETDEHTDESRGGGEERTDDSADGDVVGATAKDGDKAVTVESESATSPPTAAQIDRVTADAAAEAAGDDATTEAAGDDATAEAAGDDDNDEPPTADELSGSTPSAVFSAEAEWRNKTMIPSFDTDEDSNDDDDTHSDVDDPMATGDSTDGTVAAAADADAVGSDGNNGSDAPESALTAESEPEADNNAERNSTPETDSGQSIKHADIESLSRNQLHQRLSHAEQQLRTAEEKYNAVVAERDTAREEREELENTVSTLQAELETARAEIKRLEGELAQSNSTPSRTLEPAEALAGTNLFIRYHSKGDATLDTAHAGTAARETVNENLRVDFHTTFERDGLTVGGESFEAFLDESIEMRFTNWVVRELIYEIRDTNNQSGLRSLYNAIPTIDRVELDGDVELDANVEDEENEENGPVTLAFDLIMRNKMGDPLIVANFDRSNRPVGGAMIEQLVRDGNEIAQQTDEFCGAVAVTTSYFEPAALEATADATSSGLLSRSRGKSFVSVSRKRGFHLCLADCLDGGFDLRVPEL